MTAALATFFDSLAAAWNGGEVTTIADHFALPLMVATDTATHFIEDDDALDTLIEGVLAGWATHGVVRAAATLGEVVTLPDDAARATVAWTRHGADNAVLLAFTALYTLAAEGDEWRIVVLDAADEDRAARAAGWR